MKRAVVEKDFTYKGFECSVILQQIGHRCGYVKIPKGHPYFDVDYDFIPVSVHGGLTYGARFLYGHEGKDDYWIGWDYGHYMDGKDYAALIKEFADDEEAIQHIEIMRSIDMKFMFDEPERVYSLDDVVEECKDVVEQLIKLGESGLTRREPREAWRDLLK